MDLNSFIFSATLILLATSITVALFKRLGFGSVLGLLVAGILVGPHSPGPYVTAHVEDLRQFTELGIVLLLFVIGLEMRPQHLWQLRREMFGLGSLQILLTGFALSFYLHWVHPSWAVVMILGFTLALSSTAFVMQLLQERAEIASKQGTTSFAILLMQDLAIVPLLILVSFLANQHAPSVDNSLFYKIIRACGALALIIGAGRYVIPFVLEKLARQSNREGFLLVVLLAIFASALAMHEAGLSMALGAFLIGVMLSGSKYNLQIQALIEPYKGLLMTLFFVAVGMSIEPSIMLQEPLKFLQHISIIVLIKWLVLFLLVWLFSASRLIALRVAFLLSQCGEFGFVLLGLAKALDLIDSHLFAIAIAVISVSMLLTPFLLRLSDRFIDRITHHEPNDDLRYDEDEAPAVRVVLAGYGRVGHAVATILHSSGIPFIAVDHNVGRVNQGKADGHTVYYGDIGDAQLLAKAKLDNNSLVILTVDDSDAVLRAVSYLRNHYPQLRIIARARDLEDCAKLLQAGATQVFPEALESSLRLAANALSMLGIPTANVDMLLDGVRNQNYELLIPENKEA